MRTQKFQGSYYVSAEFFLFSVIHRWHFGCPCHPCASKLSVGAPREDGGCSGQSREGLLPVKKPELESSRDARHFKLIKVGKQVALCLRKAVVILDTKIRQTPPPPPVNSALQISGNKVLSKNSPFPLLKTFIYLNAEFTEKENKGERRERIFHPSSLSKL